MNTQVIAPMTATPYHFNYIGIINGLHEACLMDEWGTCVASFKAASREAAEANCKAAMHACNEHAALCAVAEAAKCDSVVRGSTPAMETALDQLAAIRSNS